MLRRVARQPLVFMTALGLLAAYFLPEGLPPLLGALSKQARRAPPRWTHASRHASCVCVPMRTHRHTPMHTPMPRQVSTFILEQLEEQRGMIVQAAVESLGAPIAYLLHDT